MSYLTESTWTDIESEIRLRPVPLNCFSVPAEVDAGVPGTDGLPSDHPHPFLGQQPPGLHVDLAFLFPNARFQVIEHQRIPIGRYHILYRPSFIQILDLALLPDFQRKGIGTFLVSRLIAAGTESGRRVILFLPRQKSVHYFFEKLGFVHVENDFELPRLEWPPGAGERLVQARISGMS